MHGSEPFKLNISDTVEIRLSKITPHDWLTYREKFRTWRKVQEAQSLRFAGFSPNEILAKLREFDSRRLIQHDVVQWVLDLEGAAEMLSLSISHGWQVWTSGQMTEEVAAARREVKDITPIIPHGDYIDSAAGVAQVKISYGEPPDPNAGTGPDPTTGTGAGTPTESGTGLTPAATIP